MKNRLKPREVNEALSDIGDLPNIPTPEETDVGKYLKVGSGGYELGNLPDTPEIPTPEETDIGKYLKVGSEGYELGAGYVPPDYSTTEHSTGIKWVDGKEIYEITKHITLDSTLYTDTGAVTGLNVISISGVSYTTYSGDKYVFPFPGYPIEGNPLSTIVYTQGNDLLVKGSVGQEVYITLRYTKNVTRKKTK